MRLFLFLFLTLAVFRAECQSMNDPAYSRYGDCRTPTSQDDIFVANVLDKATPAMEPDKPKGYLGTIGIVGGGLAYSEKLYIAALSALRVGADAVHIICYNAVGSSIQSLSPDIVVHPTLDTDWARAIQTLQKMDVILVGPGLDETDHGFHVINCVFSECAKHQKPLILHVDDFFLTQHTVNLFSNYPNPGIILITDDQQFEKIYPLIKQSNIFSRSHAHIKFEELGNFMIMRTGCTDVAMSGSPMASWSNSNMKPMRKTAKQDLLISGATAIYFYWARKTLDPNETAVHGPMFPAAVATYAASKMVRRINKLAVEENGRSATTLDMIEKIHEALYGMG